MGLVNIEWRVKKRRVEEMFKWKSYVTSLMNNCPSVFGIISCCRLNTFSLIILHMKLLKFLCSSLLFFVGLFSFCCFVSKEEAFSLFSRSSNAHHAHVRCEFVITEKVSSSPFSDALGAQPFSNDREKHFWRHRLGRSISLLFGFRWFSSAGEF